ncbi:uncharacterized protein LOC143767708 [Ranitomeya variabilis]|uniref:uncharacterized protein LOC143767708 n=1 Tax=Ranitomeya variabilis TaxID=490064 RepID=UPI0040563B5D
MGDRHHAYIIITRRLWEQVCQQLVENWEDLDIRAQNQARERIVKRWRSIRDRFKKEFNKEMWAPSEFGGHRSKCKRPVVPPVNNGEQKHRRQHLGACRLEPFWSDPSGDCH